MDLGVAVVVVRTPFEDFTVRVERGGVRAEGERLELARWAASHFRFGIEVGDPGVVRAARELVALLDSDGFGLVPLDDGFGVASRSSGFDVGAAIFTAVGGIAGRLEDELLAGRLVVERERTASLTDRREPFLPELPPLPPPRREGTTRTFEVRFVDEVGKAISGIDAEFSADDAQTRATNAAGVALLDGVQTSSAKVAIVDAQALAKVLDPRWEKFRPGVPPKESNTQEVVFRGDELGPFSLKAEQPNTVVIKPPLGKLFVELWDKTGRVRHANRTYQISGPQAFEGTTDDQGRLLHELVFPGNYQLSLALDFFAPSDPDRAMDIVESPLVVLEAAAAEPQVRRVGVVPRSVLARLHFFFNTNKAFLLPTALPSVRLLRRLYFDNAPCKLLVVGHADTRGGSDFNEKLSLERARATVAYLKDDVDAWLAFYDESDAKRCWGKTEDHLMIIAMPDFRDKPKGEEAVRWYQRTRGLAVDGDAGKKTRRALVEEYMSLDGASLEDLTGAIEATPHGCGEAFPLGESGEEVDAAAADEKRDPGDRRVELFFFGAEFGITPPPPGDTSKPGSPEYPLWRKRVSETVELRAEQVGPKVQFIEVDDSLLRTNSAVILPEGEAPSADSEAHESLTSVSAFALVLRLNEERPGKKLFVAGHADTTATEKFNQKLSQERAECALALLAGDRQSFVDICDARHIVADYKQILAWVARAFPDFSFPCDPGKIDDNASTGVTPVRRFQEAYNANRVDMGIAQGPIGVDGSVGKQTWGAFFDCYEVALARELGEDAARVQELRKLLVFVDDDRKALGFGEHFPVEELGVDNFRSQTNRRVELMMFDPGEEPDLAHAADDPETSELYLPGTYQRSPLPLRPGGAKPHLTLTVGLYRPNGVRSGIFYELRNDAGTYRRRLSEEDATGEQDETLLLDFSEVPMDSPLTLEQILDGAVTVLASQVAPEALLASASAPKARVTTIGAARAEESTSFLSYDLEGALV